ncbi:MAG TPA: methionyl-tRNA formyltransferase [Cyclobacteriaceae bacterium]
MDNLRIVFMGTPEFAVPSLRILVENNKNIVGVITAPDKPRGRGKHISSSPIKEYCLNQGLNILQPKNLKDHRFLDQLKALQPDLQVVVAFRMLPEVVWSLPPLGTFNLHASLLPQYRGAAPINWAIINGEKETGVTTFFLKHEIDTGDLIFQEKEAIMPEDDAGSLYHRLMKKGANLVLKTVVTIEKNNFSLKSQEAREALKPAPKIFKNTCRIDWNQSAARIKDFVRGLSPHPSAWTLINNKICKIFRVNITKAGKEEHPGNYETDGENYLRFRCPDGYIEVIEIQMEGKKKMEIKAFLRGNKL